MQSNLIFKQADKLLVASKMLLDNIFVAVKIFKAEKCKV